MPTSLTKREVLADLKFGERTAEAESDELAAYFVETDQWKKIYSGIVDIVYGAKGSGKSAIYSLLLKRREELMSKAISVVPAENPRGTPVFQGLVVDPPATEDEFRGLWKVYFLCLVAGLLRSREESSANSKTVISTLEEAGLLPKDASRQGMLRSALEYVRSIAKAESIEGGIKIDPVTGAPVGVTGKITLREPSILLREKGLISADALLRTADRALGEQRLKVWIVLDRLDVAFAESSELESNALRAAFRVYLDLQSLDNISAKIFLRTDIWKRITAGGFREASHITKSLTLNWDPQSLLNLVISRALHNKMLPPYYGVNAKDVLENADKQKELFYRIFPPQVDSGPRKPTTFDWMLSRTCDGTGQTAPRELVHLLSCARDVQLKKLERGEPDPPNGNLFDRPSLKEALPEVSRARYDQTLCAEYPDLIKTLRALEGEKTEQSPETLATIWGVDRERSIRLAERLIDIGFFQKRGTKESPTYWVPFLYRDALSMVQGSAE